MIHHVHLWLCFWGFWNWLAENAVISFYWCSVIIQYSYEYRHVGVDLWPKAATSCRFKIAQRCVDVVIPQFFSTILMSFDDCCFLLQLVWSKDDSFFPPCNTVCLLRSCPFQILSEWEKNKTCFCGGLMKFKPHGRLMVENDSYFLRLQKALTMLRFFSTLDSASDASQCADQWRDSTWSQPTDQKRH